MVKEVDVIEVEFIKILEMFFCTHFISPIELQLKCHVIFSFAIKLAASYKFLEFNMRNGRTFFSMQVSFNGVNQYYLTSAFYIFKLA